MKIEWTAGWRRVPHFGIFNTGDVRDVPDHLGRNLIRQGLAVEVKPPQAVDKTPSKGRSRKGGED